MRQSRLQIFDWVIRCSLFRIKWQLISPTAPPNQQISQRYQNKCSSRIESGSSFYMHTHILLHKSKQTQWGEPRTTEYRRDYRNNSSLALCLRSQSYVKRSAYPDETSLLKYCCKKKKSYHSCLCDLTGQGLASKNK